jgi:NADH-quinone oxidoreductase subunit L
VTWVAGALPAVPLVAALVGLPLTRHARSAATVLAVGAALAALGLAVTLAVYTSLHSGPIVGGWRIVDFGGLPVTASVRVGSTAANVSVAVTVVAAAVQIYSVGYLRPDDRYPPYAAQVSLFTAAMLLVVVADDLIPLLVGWEVMGICSYLLIAHDRALPEAPGAAVKAFLVTRVGDVGFLIGIVLLGLSAGSFRIPDVLAAHLSPARLTLATLLLLAGVAGKSAQFPLHTWLPDAMAGPTPISALIHAATMVAAGIYVVARLYPLFLAAPATLATLGVVAAITMLLGALAATAQDDIKRVLAWSTVSQIAYMSGALAVGAAPVALFHLLTHAGFKALLFLAAGCVIHSVGSNSMALMGGLRRVLPVTFWCFTIGLAALAGVPPFSGFWSKDAVLASAFDARSGGPVDGWVGWLVWLAGLATALVTAWYATRLWLRVFFGTNRGDEEPHDPDALLIGPVVLLAVPAALLGLVGLWPAFAHRLGADSLVHLDAAALAPPACLVVGAGLAWAAWRTNPAADPARALGRAAAVFARAFYLDDVQQAVVVRPVRRLAALTRRADESIVDGTVESTGRGALNLGGVLAGWHRAALPRAATAVLGGALLIGLAAVIVAGTR